MTNAERDSLKETYIQLAHAMQSGVKFDQETGSDDGSPKHLRVGINSAMSNHAALAYLLISKGVITEDEYLIALHNHMLEEVQRYEELLSKKLGRQVTLS